MKVLVSGAHGYIGSVTVPVLREAGHEVTGADILLYDGCDLEGTADETDARLRLDVRDVQPSDLEGFDAVVHLAALSNDPLGALSPELTREINHQGTVQLARAAKVAGASRFVFASSCSMYGASGESEIDETAALQPLTAYAESKVLAEQSLTELADDDFSPVFMRNSTAYGVSPRLRLDVVLNNLAAWAFTTGEVRILSDGTPWRPLVHVADISRATAAILDAPREHTHLEAYNIGTGRENYQVRDLAEVVRETAGDCTVEYAGSGDPDPRSYRVDFGKLARAFPDFEFEWTARRGAEQLLSAYERAGLTLDDFEGDRFVRLRRLTALLDEGALGGDLRRAAA